MDNVICDKIVMKTGNSMVVNLTKELKMLDLTIGDAVRITIEKI